jgi:hypothetical protein
MVASWVLAARSALNRERTENEGCHVRLVPKIAVRIFPESVVQNGTIRQFAACMQQDRSAVARVDIRSIDERNRFACRRMDGKSTDPSVSSKRSGDVLKFHADNSEIRGRQLKLCRHDSRTLGLTRGDVGHASPQAFQSLGSDVDAIVERQIDPGHDGCIA